jgi:hypothetical protein
MSAEVTPKAITATLAAFVDTLLPGDDLFPPASATGTQGVLAERLRAGQPPETFAELVRDLASNGQPFAELSADERVEAVRRLEREQPDLFAFLRMATYLAYYATPPVIAAIRALGHEYNDAPQPEGYDLPKFSFTPGPEYPIFPRGSFKWTEFIQRIDISSLSDLELPVAER